ncbi:MAG: hypothetical protein IIU36_02510 [Firmicutes bacterium]|nr:hypothetical protein [Bacillota bacterium]
MKCKNLLKIFLTLVIVLCLIVFTACAGQSEGTIEGDSETATESESKEGSETEQEPEIIDEPEEEITYKTVFEEIRDAYEHLMNGDTSDGTGVGYLRYPEVQWTVDNYDEVGGVVYSLYDINSDGTPEMVMGYPEFYPVDTDTNYTVFEIYAFDGKEAVPLRRTFETDFDYINIYDDGTIGTHIGNGGDPNEEVYVIQENSAELEHTGTRDILDNQAKSAEIHFNMIIEKIE